MRRTRQRLFVLAKVAAAVGLLLFLLWNADWALMTGALYRTREDYLLLALICFSGTALLEVGRLRVALAPYSLGWLQLARLHLLGAFFGSFLPGQLGADLYKASWLTALDRGVARPLTFVLLLRMHGLAVALAAALTCMLLLQSELSQWSIGLGSLPHPDTVVLVSSIAALAAAAILAHPSARSKFVNHSARFLHQAREAALSVTARQTSALLSLSVLTVGARALVLYCLARAVGESIGLEGAVLVVAFATLILLIPLSFGGLGLREGAVTFFLVQQAVPYEKAVLVALLGRALILLLSGLGGTWALYEAALERRPSGAK